MLTYTNKGKEQPMETVQRRPQASQYTLSAIPNGKKTQFENIPGFSYDDVMVHYNSLKPMQLQAVAYKQGPQIYVKSGQEKHIGSEWEYAAHQKGESNKATSGNHKSCTYSEEPLSEKTKKTAYNHYPCNACYRSKVTQLLRICLDVGLEFLMLRAADLYGSKEKNALTNKTADEELEANFFCGIKKKPHTYLGEKSRIPKRDMGFVTVPETDTDFTIISEPTGYNLEETEDIVLEGHGHWFFGRKLGAYTASEIATIIINVLRLRMPELPPWKGKVILLGCNTGDLAKDVAKNLTKYRMPGIKVSGTKSKISNGMSESGYFVKNHSTSQKIDFTEDTTEDTEIHTS